MVPGLLVQRHCDLRIHFQGWLKTRSASDAQILRELFDRIYNDAHEFVQTKLVPKMNLLESMYIRQSIDLLEGLFLTVVGNGSDIIALQLSIK